MDLNLVARNRCDDMSDDSSSASATFCRLITITPFYIYIAAKIITQIFAAKQNE